MRKIIFKEIGMENYGPYIEPFILKCIDDLLVLITGPNGIGKTIALDSLSFTLYGITGKGERGDDVVNNRVGKNCHTWTKFEDEENRYRIDRYHKHSKYKNTVHITRNNEKKPYKVGHREVNAEVDRLIGDRKTFTNTLMFGQKVKDFFTDLPDSEQKGIFWKLLDLLKYGYYGKTAKDEIDATKKSLEEADRDIGIAQGVVLSIDSSIQQEIEKSKRFEEDQKVSIEEKVKSSQKMLEQRTSLKLALEKIPEQNMEEIQERIFTLKAKMNNIGKEAEAIHKNLQSAAESKRNELVATSQTKKSELSKKYQAIKDELVKDQTKYTEKFNEKIREIDAAISVLNSDKAASTATIASTQARINDLTQNHLDVGSKCPVCLEKITQKSIDNIESILNNLKAEIQTHALTVKAADLDIEKHRDNMAQVKKEYNVLKQTINMNFKDAEQKEKSGLKEIDDRLEEVKKELLDVINKKLKEEIADLETNAAIMQKDLNIAEAEYAEMHLKEKERQDLINSIAEYKHQINTLASQIEEMRNKPFDESTLKSLKVQKYQQLEIIQRKEGETKEIRDELKRLEFWKEAYSPRGLPSMLIDQAIPSMNKTMKKYLELLSNGRYIVAFDTISTTKGGEYRDKFSVNVLDTKTQVNNKKQLSGGQTRLIDIATILTLRELKADLGGVDFNLFIFDEIFDALDDANIGYVCNILNSLKENRSIFVIAHKHQDELEADTHIQLT